MVPALAVAPKVTVPVPQELAGVFPVMEVIVAIMAVRVAVVQPVLVAST